MGEGGHYRDSHETESTGSFRADTGGGSPNKTGTCPLTQDAHSGDRWASEGGASQHYGGRSSQGTGGGRESGLRHPDANTTGPDRHRIDRIKRANGRMDEGVTNATFRPHSRTHLFSYSRVLGAPFVPQTAGDHHKDPLQDSGARTHVLTSGINTNSFEHRHGYIGRSGSFR